MSNLEKNTWIKTDDTQWVKYLNISDENEHWFKIVDCMVNDRAEEPYFVFNAMTVLIENSDLENPRRIRTLLVWIWI